MRLRFSIVIFLVLANSVGFIYANSSFSGRSNPSGIAKSALKNNSLYFSKIYFSGDLEKKWIPQALKIYVQDFFEQNTKFQWIFPYEVTSLKRWLNESNKVKRIRIHSKLLAKYIAFDYEIGGRVKFIDEEIIFNLAVTNIHNGNVKRLKISVLFKDIFTLFRTVCIEVNKFINSKRVISFVPFYEESIDAFKYYALAREKIDIDVIKSMQYLKFSLTSDQSFARARLWRLIVKGKTRTLASFEFRLLYRLLIKVYGHSKNVRKSLIAQCLSSIFYTNKSVQSKLWQNEFMNDGGFHRSSLSKNWAFSMWKDFISRCKVFPQNRFCRRLANFLQRKFQYANPHFRMIFILNWSFEYLVKSKVSKVIYLRLLTLKQKILKKLSLYDTYEGVILLLEQAYFYTKLGNSYKALNSFNLAIAKAIKIEYNQDLNIAQAYLSRAQILEDFHHTDLAKKDYLRAKNLFISNGYNGYFLKLCQKAINRLK